MSAPWYDLRIARGMSAQLTRWHERLKAGEKALGWKVGFGAPTAMEALKITAPLIGHLTDGARLEWLPMESIAHSGCLGENTARFDLEGDAEMIGWDVLALGLPAAGEAFAAGRFVQHLELPGVWLERGVIDSADARLLSSPLGLADHTTLLTLWFAVGQTMPDARVDALVDAARGCVAACGDGERVVAGVTSLRQQVVVLRALAHRVEPAMALARTVRAAWRGVAWQLASVAPRVWRT